MGDRLKPTLDSRKPISKSSETKVGVPSAQKHCSGRLHERF